MRAGFTRPLLVLSLFVLTFLTLPVHAALDIQVGLTGNEPTTAAVDPLRPNVVAVARGLNVSISTDFGRTFGAAIAPGPNPPVYGTIVSWGGCGDASLAFDSQGRLFFSYLLCGSDSGGNRVDISALVQQFNVTTGATVGNPVEVGGATIDSDDKEWIAADASLGSPFRDNLYVVWTRLTSGSQVMFSRSTDGGLNWSTPRRIDGGEGFVWPSHVAVAPNGDVYVTYHGDTCGSATAQMYVLRDTNGGAQFAAGAGFQKTSFTSAVTCNVQASNPPTAIAGTDFWMQGAMQGFVIPDPIRPGYVYVVANDDPEDDFTTGDPGDVILARSTDDGQTWSVSTVSHGPVGTLQAFPTGSVDQLGNLVISWWDTRRGLTNGGGNFLLDQYATVSRDGGQTFTFDFRVSDFGFDPDLNAPCRFGPSGCGTVSAAPNTLRIGEYNGAAAADGAGYVIWTGNAGTNPPSGGQTTYFDAFTILGAFPDAAEPNDSFDPGVASVLGAGGTYSVQDLTIHSDEDEDFFRVVALHTGKLFFRIDYQNRFSDLDVQVRDKFNNVVATSTAGADTLNIESIVIPAVAGEEYYVRVFAEPGQSPPLNTYDLSIINTPAPVPFGITLAPGSDSGVSGSDNLTNVAMPTILLKLDTVPLAGLAFSPDNGTATLADDPPGYKVEIYLNGNAVGRATPSGNLFTFTFTAPLLEGLNFITARVVIVDNSDNTAVAGTAHAVGKGGESDVLAVTLDTTPPAAGAIGPLDLLASSDSGGISDDDITTFSTPSFTTPVLEAGFVRIFAQNLAGGGAVQVAQFTVTNPQTWQFVVQSMSDGVYAMTARIEDPAGNLGPATASLKVTIAKYSLTLPGNTATPTVGGLTVDLASQLIQGYGGVAGSTGSIGIAGIPTINLDANTRALTVLLTMGDDTLDYTPASPTSGSFALAGVNQTIRFMNVNGNFFVNAFSGNDTVWTRGGAASDSVVATVQPNTTVQVSNWKAVTLNPADVEKIGISTFASGDNITVRIYDTVTAYLTVDGGEPTTVNKGNDALNLYDMSTGRKGVYSNISGGSTPGSGAVLLAFKAAGTSTRVDYMNIEKQTRK